MDDLIEFDNWNMVKKITQRKTLPGKFFCREREVWWCSIGINIGIETNGKHQYFERPVLIVRTFNKEMIWVVPITSTIKKLDFYYPIEFENEKRSVMLTQLRVMSTKRLRRKVDTLSELDFQNIRDVIASFLKSETPPDGGESRSPKALIDPF